TGEALHSALAAGVLLCLLRGLGDDTRRWKFALAAGALSGLALWTKLTAVVLVAMLGMAGALELRDRRRAAPWLCALLLSIAMAAPLLVHNHRQWGVYLVSSFESSQKWGAERMRAFSFWERRPLDFYLGWQSEYFALPYIPEDPHARFWPTLVA